MAGFAQRRRAVVRSRPRRRPDRRLLRPSPSHLIHQTLIQEAQLPSGQVLLTSSSDLSSRIFAASPPPNSFLLQNPRTFHAPHTRGVSAASAIGKGRFIITACRDGGLRVWEVKTGEVVAEGIWPGGSAVGVEAMIITRLGAATEAEPTEGAEDWPPEFVSSLTVVLALSSGSLHVVSLPSLKPWSPDRQPARPPSTPSSLDSLDFSPDASHLATGSRNGVVSIYAIASTSLSLVCSWRRNESGINSIRFIGPDRVSIAGADGLPYVARLGADGEVVVEEEWAGLDTDPATSVRFVDGRGFVAGSDGGVRIYH